jgi:3,4-dihydroxy 2-butanone 4-phosphate synthase/GTP cyclohydrolase II
VSGLREQGITVAGRIPIVIPPNRHNAEYLKTKQQRSGHWLGMAANSAISPASTPTLVVNTPTA